LISTPSPLQNFVDNTRVQVRHIGPVISHLRTCNVCLHVSSVEYVSDFCTHQINTRSYDLRRDTNNITTCMDCTNNMYYLAMHLHCATLLTNGREPINVHDQSRSLKMVRYKLDQLIRAQPEHTIHADHLQILGRM